jgi:hypothetical protein
MTLSIADDAVPIVKESLERELMLLESKVNLLKKEIEDFEVNYKMSSSEFLTKFESGDAGDAQDFFVWWGLLRGLEKVNEKIEQVKVVLSSCRS